VVSKILRSENPGDVAKNVYPVLLTLEEAIMNGKTDDLSALCIEFCEVQGNREHEDP